jgi:hypothetical protein
VVRSSPIILAIRRGSSADTLAGALTPKAIIWIVMQITKIHFLTSAALVVAPKPLLRCSDSAGAPLCAKVR